MGDDAPGQTSRAPGLATSWLRRHTQDCPPSLVASSKAAKATVPPLAALETKHAREAGGTVVQWPRIPVEVLPLGRTDPLQIEFCPALRGNSGSRNRWRGSLAARRGNGANQKHPMLERSRTPRRRHEPGSDCVDSRPPPPSIGQLAPPASPAGWPGDARSI